MKNQFFNSEKISSVDFIQGRQGALQTIEFKADGTNTWLTVFARSGNKVKLMDESMFMTMQVGDINQDWSRFIRFI